MNHMQLEYTSPENKSTFNCQITFLERCYKLQWRKTKNVQPNGYFLTPLTAQISADQVNWVQEFELIHIKELHSLPNCTP
uniref:Uncharacterized protein n=1 Tax=Rhizophora mucronata TaxID=61149 RepID=A0A2P2LY25_RHIMU